MYFAVRLLKTAPWNRKVRKEGMMEIGEAVRSVDRKEQQAPLSAAKRNYILGLLTAVFALNFLDRSLLGVVLEPVKKEFALSDTMMGLMLGFGFALMQTGAGLIVARYADRKSRVPLIALGLTFTSVMTAVGGAVVSAWQMFLTRIGVGLGQSTGTSPSQATISDIFPKDRRPFAMSIFQMGPLLGGYLGFLIGGLATYYYNWRTAFFFAGIPGIVIGLLLYFTVKEPPRGLSDGAKADTNLYSLGDTVRYLIANRTFVWCTIGNILASYTNFSVGAWLAAFLRRIHHLNQAQIGVWGGTVKSVAGLAGVLIGGYIVQRVGKGNDKWKILAPAIALFISGPLFLIFLFPDSLSMAFFGLALAIFFSAFYNGPLIAVTQSVVKVRMRALAAATYMMPGALISYGCAPLVIGIINDALNPRYGAASVRYSLITAPIACMLGALCFMAASRSVNQDIKKALKESAEMGSARRPAK